MKTDYFDKAAQQFANLMIEKIQQVEDNWQKPWITIAANTRNFFPQNLTGRRYAGGNAFLLLFLCEKFQYQTPVFMTFNQAKEAGISVLKGSKSFPVYYFLFYVYHKETRKKITFEEYKALSREQQQEYNVIPTYKYYSVFNLDQTNFSDVRPEEWEALREKFRGGQAEQPDGTTGEAHPEIDAMLEAKSWFCPIREQQGDRAFYSPLADRIVVPMKLQFNIGKTPEDVYRGGMEYYSTMLHEMTHSTMTAERLNREMGGKFGDPKYAKEELVAELTAAMISHSMGFDSKITDNSAAYLDSWIGVLKKEPKFIVSIMADVNKASDLILDHVDKQRLALGEQPYLAKNDPFAPLSADEEVPFKNAAIIKTRSGDYAIRASYDGVELGLKKVTKDTAKTFFQLTDQKDKTAFLNMTARKSYEPELAVMRRNQKVSSGISL